MDNFIRHVTRAVCMCSFFWNVVHSSDFEQAHKDFEETQKRHEEMPVKAQELRSSSSSFGIIPIVIPIVMVMLFLTCCVIICCIAYRRRQRFWAMHQDQQNLVAPPLAVAPGPGPVTSGATGYNCPNQNPPIPIAVTLPPPVPYVPQPAGLPPPYAPQPAGLYPMGGPYISPLGSGLVTPVAPYPPQPAGLHPTGGPYGNLSSAPSVQPSIAAGIQWPSAPPPLETK